MKAPETIAAPPFPPPSSPLSPGRGEGQLTWRGMLLAAGLGAVVLGAMPWVLPPYPMIVLGSALVFAIACLGLSLLLGHAGLLSLGHAAYFGMGAYAGGFLYSFGELTSLELYLLAGVLAAASLAALVGLLCVQSTRMHFTILTLAFAQVIHSLFIAGTVFRLAGGQGQGLFLLGGGGLYIPRFAIARTDFPPEHFTTALYYVILCAFLAAVLVMWRIVSSPFGVTLRAIRDNEVRAACIGVRIRRYRWGAFVISGIFVGLAGGLFGQLDRQVTPEQLHWLLSAKLVLATVLGGSRHFLGPIVGGILFIGLQEVALRFTLSTGAVLGLALILMVLACPGGVVGSGAALARRVWQRERA